MEMKRKNSMNINVNYNESNENPNLIVKNNVLNNNQMNLFKFRVLSKILEEMHIKIVQKTYDLFNLAEKCKNDLSINHNDKLELTKEFSMNNVKHSLFNQKIIYKIEREWELFVKLYFITKNSDKSIHLNCNEKEVLKLLSLLERRSIYLNRFNELISLLKNKQESLRFTKEFSILKEIS